MKRYYVLFFVLVLSFPFLLGINAWLANECGLLRNGIQKFETEQVNLVDANRTVIAEIADLLSVERIENEAKENLGMRKIRPENVTLIIMGGRGRGL